MIYDNILLIPQPGRKFKLAKPLKYKDVIVPSGYVTNGADVPRLFWSIYTPDKPDYIGAIIVHDYLCDLEQYEKADKYLEELLNGFGIRKINIFIIVSSVKLYHYIRYEVLK